MILLVLTESVSVTYSSPIANGPCWSVSLVFVELEGVVNIRSF